MNTKRWNYIKSLGVRGRYTHVSAYAKMIPDPTDPTGKPMIPYIERPGKTLVLHRKARGTNETNKPRIGGAA
jgi:hypothetical protein